MTSTTHSPSKLANFRDLGGIPCDLGTVATGLLFRSDELATIDDLEAQRVAEKGVSLIIDLRSSGELDKLGRGPLANHDISYLHLSLMMPELEPHKIMAGAFVSGFSAANLGEWYLVLLTRASSLVLTALENIALASGPVLFHCAAGKDRTGLVAACVLSILGASDDQIADDYAKTQQAMPNIIARLRANMPEMNGMTPDQMIATAGSLMRADRESMEVFLAETRRQHGSVVEFLRTVGLTEELESRLRAKYLVS